MTLDEYQKLAARTLLDKPQHEVHGRHLVDMALSLTETAVGVYSRLSFRMCDPGQIMLAWNVAGLVGECGELVELFKKHVYHQHPLDKAKVADELGDIFWYLAAVYTRLDMPFSEAALPPSLVVSAENFSRQLYCILLDIIDDVGLTRDYVLAGNITKLQERYPDGFTPADSLARVDVSAGQVGVFE